MTDHPTARTVVIAAWFVAASILAASMLLRVVHRGEYIPGFDVVGAANGMNLVAHADLHTLAERYRDLHTVESAAWNVLGLPVAILPGALAYLWPWEWWPHVVTFTFTSLAFLLLGRALGFGTRDGWLVLLGWASSSALVSYSVMGFPYISNLWPFAVALHVVLRPHRWPVALLLGLVALELSWHVQELGRTVFVVFLAASCLLPGIELSRRALYAALGGVQLWLAATFHSFNTANYAGMRLPALGQAASAGRALALHFLSQKPDIFVLLPLGLVAVLCMSRRIRWFWRAIVGFHWGLVCLLASNSGTLQGVTAVWPRRILVLTFLSLAATLALTRESTRARRWLTVALLLGSLAQLGHTAWWASRPLDADHAEWDFTLPYTHTEVPNGAHLDSKVAFFVTDWYVEMRKRLDHGGRVLLLYNLSSYDENATDPAGIPDRLLLHLGPERFARQVLIFGQRTVRWSTLPIRPLRRFRPFVNGLRDPKDVQGYWLDDVRDHRYEWDAARLHRRGIKTMIHELEGRFEIIWEAPVKGPAHRTLKRFRLRPRFSSGTPPQWAPRLARGRNRA